MREDDGMTLTEFLLARIAEDESVARNSALDLGGDGRRPDWHEPSSGVLDTGDDLWPIGDSAISRHAEHFDPARVLAECEAKRRIVHDEHFDGRSGDYSDPWCATCSDDENLVHLPCPTLRLLALPYSDHPGYRDEWRP